MAIEKDYIERILVNFIQDELKKGHSLEEIKKSLRDVGHTEKIINNAVNLVVGNYSRIDFDEDDSEMDKDLFFESVDELASYVKDNMDHNVSISKIKENLRDVGHNHDIVEDAINKVTKLNMKKIYFDYLKYFIYLVPIFFYFATNSNPLLIGFAFLPIIFMPLLMGNFKSIYFPLILNLIHFILIFFSFIFSHSIFQIFTINILFSYLLFIPYYNIVTKEKTKETKNKKLKKVKSINKNSS